MLSVDEILTALRPAFSPYQCSARPIDHREMIEIEIKSPTGELLFSVDPISRDELLSEKDLQLFIDQIKRRIVEKP